MGPSILTCLHVVSSGSSQSCADAPLSCKEAVTRACRELNALTMWLLLWLWLWILRLSIYSFMVYSLIMWEAAPGCHAALTETPPYRCLPPIYCIYTASLDLTPLAYNWMHDENLHSLGAIRTLPVPARTVPSPLASFLIRTLCLTLSVANIDAHALMSTATSSNPGPV